MKALIVDSIKIFSGYVFSNYMEMKEEGEIEIKKNIKDSKIQKSEIINQRLEILETEGSNGKSRIMPKKFSQVKQEDIYDENVSDSN